MSNNLAYGRAIAAAAGQAQGQQQNIARMLGVWSAPQHQGDDNRREEQRRGGAAYFARLQADDRQRQQDALQERQFQNNAFLEQMRQKGRDELQTDRLASTEQRAADAIAAANQRAADRIAAAEAAATARATAAEKAATEKDTAREKANNERRTVAERNRLLTPAGQAETSANIRRLAPGLPGVFGAVAGMAVSDPEFAKIKAEYGRAATTERHREEDRTERADVRGDRKDTAEEKAAAAAAAKTQAAHDKVMADYYKRLEQHGAEATNKAQKEYEHAIDPVFGTFGAPKEGETPEEFDARKEAFRSEEEARQFRGLSRETQLHQGLTAIEGMSSEEATREWNDLGRLVKEGRLSKEDHATLNDALIARIQGAAKTSAASPRPTAAPNQQAPAAAAPNSVGGSEAYKAWRQALQEAIDAPPGSEEWRRKSARADSLFGAYERAGFQ